MSAVTKIAPVEEPIGVAVPGGMFISDEQLMRINADPKKARRELRLMLADLKEKKPKLGPVEKPTLIRVATHVDAQKIFELLLEDLAENAQLVAPVSRERVWNHISNALSREGGMIGVIDKPGSPGEPVAVVIMQFSQWWWSEAWFVQELTNYVHPDHRRSNYAEQLIDFVSWVVDTGSRQLGYRQYALSGVLSLKRVREKIRLYSRKVTQAGAFFLYPWPGGLE